VRESALRLALVFDDPVALNSLRAQAVDRSLTADNRRHAIDALVGRRPPALDSLLLTLVDDPAVRTAALRGLAHYRHPETTRTILRGYPHWDYEARQQALQTLATRIDWAAELLDAVESQQIAQRDLSAYTVRQIQSLGDSDVNRRLEEIWGAVRGSDRDRQREIERLRRALTPEVLRAADATAGRAVFERQCANCHRFFDSGGSIGPDITGAQRTNLDYLLENMIDPSAVVARDFQMHVVETVDGRVLTGLIESESEQALTLLTINERLVVPLDEIEHRQRSPVSIMPDGLLGSLSSTEVRDLIGYLQSDHTSH
jgi:putative heme-binding domain-containing protein